MTNCTSDSYYTVGHTLGPLRVTMTQTRNPFHVLVTRQQCLNRRNGVRNFQELTVPTLYTGPVGWSEKISSRIFKMDNSGNT